MKKTYPFPKLFLLFFFLSGASALMFETIWQRMMMLVFGASALATTAILTALLFGIGVGSWLGGRLLARTKKTLVFYAGIELWIGLWGIAVPGLLHLMDFVQKSVLSSVPMDFTASFLFRFCAAMLVVFPSAMGMGATIPVMNRMLVKSLHTVGRGVSLAYGINTIGSVLGSLSVGFFLIPHIGLKGSLFVTGGLNILVALGTVLWMKSQALKASYWSKDDNAEKKAAAAADFQPGSAVHSRILVLIYMAASFLALGYEVLWFRLLGLFATNSVLTISIGLSVYLLGFSLGSLLFYPWLTRRLPVQSVYVLSNVGTGLSVLCLIPVMYWFPHIQTDVFLTQFQTVADVFSLLFIRELFLALVMVFIPTLFMGLAYPAVCHLRIGTESDVSKDSGWIYFLGCLSAALGAAVVGLTVIPSMDLSGTLAFLVAGSFILGLITLLLGKIKLKDQQGTVLIILTGLAVTAGYGLWAYPFVADGFLKAEGSSWVYRDQKPGETISLIYYRSGPSGTVSVLNGEGVSDGPVRMILVDGQPVAATEIWSRTDAKLLAHLPLLLHPHPRNVITVGYGSGVTSWSMTRYGGNVDCVEIEPRVYQASELFEEANHAVPRLRNFHMIIDDARNFFHLTSKRYDVISTDVTNLHYKRNSSLYTTEYFRLLKERLSPRGIVAAWVPMAGVSDYEYKILLKSFQSVFPHTSVWFVGENETSYYSIVIGTPGPLKVDYQRLKSLFRDEGIRADLEDINIRDPLTLLSFLLMDESRVRHYTGRDSVHGDVPLHTDDYPVLEFHPLGSWNASVNASNLYRYQVPDPSLYVTNADEEERDMLRAFFRGEEVRCNQAGLCEKMNP